MTQNQSTEMPINRQYYEETILTYYYHIIILILLFGIIHDGFSHKHYKLIILLYNINGCNQVKAIFYLKQCFSIFFTPVPHIVTSYNYMTSYICMTYIYMKMWLASLILYHISMLLVKVHYKLYCRHSLYK